MEISINVCRICLCLQAKKHWSKMKSVFEKDENKVKIAKKIYDISGIFIEKTEHLPEKICVKCNKQLNLAYLFRCACQEADIKLKTSKHNDDIIKHEFIKFEDDPLLEIIITQEELEKIEKDDEKIEEDYEKFEKIEEYDDQSIDISTDFNKNENLSENNDILQVYNENLEENNENLKTEDTKLHSSEIINLKISEINKLKLTKYTKCKKAETNFLEDKITSTKPMRRSCYFNNAWFQEYDWIKHGKSKFYAGCAICNCEFSICHGGRSDIARHINTGKHQQNLNPLLVKERVFRGNGVKFREVSIIICEICGNRYPSRSHLRTHLKYHSDTLDHECEICHKKFRLSMQVRKHMRVHTGEKPYSCKFCGKRFTDFSSKIKHERSHTNERPYSCDTCGKTFTSAGVCKKHKMIHTGEKPHTCQICNKSFTERTQLKTHCKSFFHQERAMLRINNVNQVKPS